MTRFASTLYLPAPAVLTLGVLLTILTGPRWGIAPLAWFAPVPYLLWARQANGGRAWGLLFSALLMGYAAQCAIFATPPVPVIGVIAFAPPLALIRFTAVALTEAVRRRLGEAAGIGTYIAATVAMDWLGYGVSEFGAWMSTANSQVEWLQFMQGAALAGLAGLTALMAWTSSAMAAAFGASPSLWTPRTRLGTVAIPLVAVTATLFWAARRLDDPAVGSTVRVAAVTTAVGLTERGMPGDAALRENTERLFEQTRFAAARDARLVVWNEIATVVSPQDEGTFIDRARTTARALQIDLVLSYGVLLETNPILFDNKYVFIADTGDVLDEYRKHHPVPGEPSLRGTTPVRVINRPYGRVGGAICYDYDFPNLAREHARLGADLVVLPSSDWRGIDPIHTYMARARSIEGGFALLRSVRWAGSGAFDAYGRTRAWIPAVEDGQGVMLADLPVGLTPTPASVAGNVPVVIAWGTLAVLVAAAFLPLSRRVLARVPATSLALLVMLSSVASAQERGSMKGRWSVEMSGGWSVGSARGSGQVGEPLPDGIPMVTSTDRPSRMVPSWWLGDGTTLFNQAAASFGEFQGRQLATMSGIDGALTQVSTDQEGGMAANIRFGYRPASRWMVALEAGIDEGQTFSKDTRATIETARDSFVTAFTDVFQMAPIANREISATARFSGRRRQYDFAATLTRTLLSRGRLEVQASAGGGLTVRPESFAQVEMEGRYAFSVNAGGQIDERDQVMVTLKQSRTAPLGLAGASASWAVSRWSAIRMEVRVAVNSHRVTTDVAASPESLSSNGALLSSYTTPGLQFSGQPGIRSSLSAAPFSATTLTETGRQMRLHVGIGYGVRF